MPALNVSVPSTEEWILQGNPEMEATLVAQIYVHYCAPESPVSTVGLMVLSMEQLQGAPWHPSSGNTNTQ